MKEVRFFWAADKNVMIYNDISYDQLMLVSFLSNNQRDERIVPPL